MAYIGIFLSALIGSGVAALADLLQKDTAGAVVKLQTTIASLLGLNLQTLWAVLLLMILGAALCFVFQPQSRQTGFALGLSVISVIMTATPTKPPSSPAGLVIGPRVNASSPTSYALLSSPAAGVPDWQVWRVQAQPNLLRLNFEVGVSGAQPRPPGEIVIRVRELPGGQVWQWKTDQFERQSNFPIQFFYEVPVSAGINAIEARIEAEHYNAATVQSAIAPGARQITLTYSLQPSTAPNFIKKLFEQRSF